MTCPSDTFVVAMSKWESLICTQYLGTKVRVQPVCCADHSYRPLQVLPSSSAHSLKVSRSVKLFDTPRPIVEEPLAVWPRPPPGFMTLLMFIEFLMGLSNKLLPVLLSNSTFSCRLHPGRRHLHLNLGFLSRWWPV